MLKLIKLNETEEIVEYNYIPQGDIENGIGYIKIKKKDGEVKESKLSMIEKENDSFWYRNHAYNKVKTFKKEYPDRYTVAWY
ncbi:hypothetical protein [Staphylococcus pasteuri]|uniref:hypothetical protein n=1 Tax=Staphylococcus pasteuri TaxID=45972 RepID=UPI0012B7EB6D|nr:hypothetical protein [Staphylococcus pasteuri]MCT1925722.1 hypothetical protein [Staphylococcus pasteuri]QQT11281.1 hypothetical protein I6J09_00635 [Staphylococcus pasteuri]